MAPSLSKLKSQQVALAAAGGAALFLYIYRRQIQNTGL
jgi:hypothetical protein